MNFQRTESNVTRIHIGHVVHSSDPGARVVTVLGSCVAVVLHSPAQGTSTMCHAFLPRNMKASGDLDGKYVVDAIAMMVNLLNAAGIGACGLQAKLFGGACMAVALPGHRNTFGVGEQNIATARHELRKWGIGVTAEEVGGTRGRQICLLPATGEVRRYHV